MHKQGCPKSNNPYAHCECAAMDMREHTEQLRIYNEAAPTVEALQIENEKLREQISLLEAWRLRDE